MTEAIVSCVKLLRFLASNPVSPIRYHLAYSRIQPQTLARRRGALLQTVDVVGWQLRPYAHKPITSQNGQVMFVNSVVAVIEICTAAILCGAVKSVI